MVKIDFFEELRRVSLIITRGVVDFTPPLMEGVIESTPPLIRGVIDS